MEKIGSFELSLQDYIASSHGELLDKINKMGDYDDQIETSLRAALKEFESSQSW